MAGRKQDSTTGKPSEPTPILANENANTEGESKHAPTKSVSASIKTALILAVLQTDFSDLQSLGLKVAILARNDRLYFSIEYPEHVLGFDTGEILLDGQKVSEM